MDLASRLKQFMDYTGLPHSQFADQCRIPRPTLSQILGGRNKKVSDEIIGKLHAQFPQLNVLWLMFGEGNMLMAGNTSFSEPQNGSNPPIFEPEPLDNNLFSVNSTPTQKPTENKTVQRQEPQVSRPTQNATQPFVNISAQQAQNSAPAPVPNNTERPHASASANEMISLRTASHKRIQNIVVFYTDNSFDQFMPAY